MAHQAPRRLLLPGWLVLLALALAAAPSSAQVPSEPPKKDYSQAVGAGKPLAASVGTLDAPFYQCETDPAEVFDPESICLDFSTTAATLNDCYWPCYQAPECFFITYYDSPPAGQPNCYGFNMFYNNTEGSSYPYCNATDLVPPDPSWGSVVFSYWNAVCPGLTFPPPGGEPGPPNTPPSLFAPPPPTVIATGDPHFVGARGTRFDFNGELGTSYCLLTDRGLHINALLKGYTTDSIVGASAAKSGKGVRSWMRELGIMWTDSVGGRQTLHLAARSGKSSKRDSGFLAAAVFNGKALPIPTTAGEAIIDSPKIRLVFVQTKTGYVIDKDIFRLTVPQKMDITLELQPPSPQYQLPDEAHVHFNVIIHSLEGTPSIHGILGQTYRKTPLQAMKAAKYSVLSKLLGEPVKADGASGYGLLDGTTKDYAASNILQPDCAVSTYAK